LRAGFRLRKRGSACGKRTGNIKAHVRTKEGRVTRKDVRETGNIKAHVRTKERRLTRKNTRETSRRVQERKGNIKAHVRTSHKRVARKNARETLTKARARTKERRMMRKNETNARGHGERRSKTTQNRALDERAAAGGGEASASRLCPSFRCLLAGKAGIVLEWGVGMVVNYNTRTSGTFNSLPVPPPATDAHARHPTCHLA
jgi:hypothetical protein